MAVEADSVVVTLLAQNEQFDAATKASASNFSKSMADIQSSGAAAEKGVGQFSSALKENRLQMNQSRIGMMEFQHIARGVSDQFATSGLSAQLFTSHIGELSEAVVLSGGAFGKLGEFLQGPWGIALTLATTLVVSLAAGHRDAGDAAKKHGTAEDELTNYINGEKVATDALVTAIDKLNDARSKGLQSTNDQIRAEAQLAAQTLQTAMAQRASLAADLAKAKAAAGAPNIITPGGTAEASGAEAKASVIAIQQSLDELDGVIGHATALIATDFTTLARNLSTHVQRANDDFDQQLKALEAKYRGTEVTKNGQRVLVGGLFNQPGANAQRLEQQLIQQEEALNATRAKAVEAARKLDQAEDGQAKSADRAAKSTGEYGRKIGFDAAEAIARGAGLHVTSGYRSDAEQTRLFNDPRYNHPGNPVARPISMGGVGSAHEGPNGKWALDIAFAPGLTPAGLKKIYGDQGVSLTAIYKESGHYHIEGTDANAPAMAAQNKAIEAQAKLWSKIDEELGHNMFAAEALTDDFKKQTPLVGSTADAMADLKTGIDSVEAALQPVTQALKDQFNEATQMGDQFVQDVLNPNNWKSFGSIAHTVLMDIMKDLETIALLNPIENWMDGGHRLTFGSLFSLFGGGGGGFDAGSFASTVASNDSWMNSTLSAGLMHFASGGAFRVNGGTDSNVLSINGQARAMVSGDETIAVIPTNASAAHAGSAGGGMLVVHVVSDDEKFGAFVAGIAGPLAVQAGTRGAYAGAGMARDNLARRQMHQLGR